MERIPIAGSWITQKEIDYVSDAAANAWYSNANIYNERFEKAFSEYLGVRYAVTLPSCTSAIHLSLAALGIRPGDEVIVPDITWIATAAPITYVGATLAFADIDPKTWCLSADSFMECITPRTKAVIPVNLYGGMPDWDEILTVANNHNICIIEDAAESIGSEYKGRKAGGFGDTGVFSFHGSKTLTTGEGGMLATNDERLFNRVLFLRDHGRDPGDFMFLNKEVAYKYKMSAMQAALGLAQLERIDELVEKKRSIFKWYRKQLEGVEGISLNNEPRHTRNSFWMVSAIIDPKYQLQKKQLIELMSRQSIDCRPFFSPLSSIPAFEFLDGALSAQKSNHISYKLGPYGINLPSALNLTEEKVEYVCNVFKRILGIESQ